MCELGVGQTERKNPKQTPCWAQRWVGSHHPETITWAKIKCWSLNRLNHWDAPHSNDQPVGPIAPYTRLGTSAEASNTEKVWKPVSHCSSSHHDCLLCCWEQEPSTRGKELSTEMCNPQEGWVTLHPWVRGNYSVSPGILLSWSKLDLLKCITPGAPGWLSQLRICLWLRSWSCGPGTEPHGGLPAQQRVLLSLPLSLPPTCARSLSNKHK